jgi:hypothetical protein
MNHTSKSNRDRPTIFFAGTDQPINIVERRHEATS